MAFPLPFEKLVVALGRLPGMGPKSARRVAFYLLGCPVGEVEELADLMRSMRQELRYCRQCFFLTWQSDICHICADPGRERSQLLVVADPKDVVTLESAKVFKGLYHVLGGVYSPLQQRGIEQLRVKELLQRLKTETIVELIFALPPSVEGEATRSLILQQGGSTPFKVSQLAVGLPVGSDIEYIDQLTLGQAIRARVPLL